MKEHYIIIVDGNKNIDCAKNEIDKMGVNKEAIKMDELTLLWKSIIPQRYPLDSMIRRMVPIPKFYYNDSKTVALFIVYSDKEFIKISEEIISNIPKELSYLVKGIKIFNKQKNEEILYTYTNELNNRNYID